MVTVNESIDARTPLGSDLKAGVDAISIEQVVTFDRYVRLVLPLDGYVFWVKADLLSPSALLNALLMNTATFNQGLTVAKVTKTIDAQGSLHFSTDLRQDESGTLGVSRMVFTSEVDVRDLSEIAPNELYVATADGVKYAFSSRGSFYRQAELFHYVGYAVYSDMDTQIIDTIAGFDSRSLVVSNSLPLWLALNGYRPTVPAYGFGNPYLTLYPSFLVPANLPPPYGAVHIDPANTLALGSAPRIGRRSSHHQLVEDRVKITMYGMRNYQALDFVDCVLQRAMDYEQFGVMNSPVIVDEKRTQPELGAIAMKKSVTFDVCYYQERMNDVARQMILSAVPTYIVGSLAAA